jgi:DNA-binding CsgD family transcriptional regulator
VALLGADGRVVYANRAFRAIAQRDGGIATRDMAGRGAFDFSVARSGGAAPYLFSVRPLAENMCAARPQSQAVAAVFIRDPSSRNTAGPRILCDVLQLTEAEVLLAEALQAGVRLKDHARARGISINTIYAHLRSIKQKTGCHRMGELIRRLNDLQAAARSDRADDGYLKVLRKSLSAFPAKILRRSASEMSSRLSASIAGLIGPSGVSVANTTLSAPKKSKPQRSACTPPPNMAVSA